MQGGAECVLNGVPGYGAHSGTPSQQEGEDAKGGLRVVVIGGSQGQLMQRSAPPRVPRLSQHAQHVLASVHADAILSR